MKASLLAVALTAGALTFSGQALAKHEFGPLGQSRADAVRDAGKSRNLLATEEPQDGQGAIWRGSPARGRHDHDIRFEGSY